MAAKKNNTTIANHFPAPAYIALGRFFCPGFGPSACNLCIQSESMPEDPIRTFKEPKGWRDAVKKIPGLQLARNLNISLEGWWFDFRNHVDTSPDLESQRKLGWRDDENNFYYVPTRPKYVRKALRHVPAGQLAEYTFIDFGSGKGRVLLMAAQLGFRRLQGIELRRELHEQARANIRRFRNPRGSEIQSLNLNAVEYEFPLEKLVVFFFNPFGPEVMGKVLNRLEDSLTRSFRDIWLILHGSVCAPLVDRSQHFKLVVASHGYRIYRSLPR
jgi:predicted RNA methylase